MSNAYEATILSQLNGEKPMEEQLQERQQAFNQIEKNLKTMNATRSNHAYRILASNRKVIGKLIVFCKKVVRKLLQWYIEPFCFQQTDFNNASNSAIRQLTALQKASIHQTDALQEQTADNTEKLEALQAGMAALEREMARLRRDDAFSCEEPEPKSIWRSASQTGEDTIVNYLLKRQGIPASACSYLDLGANHAIALSNTYAFYEQGARGVLVEANPDLIGELEEYRKGDIILNRCVADTSGNAVDFYILNGDGLSSPDAESVREALEENEALRIEKTVSVETITVDEIMERYFDGAPVLLNMDLEGNELEILGSMDFDKHRPLIVIVEMIPYRKELVVGEKNREILAFMQEHGYEEYAFTGINSIFLDKQQMA